MGAFVRDLILCQNYFETIFVRIPKKIHDEIVEVLQSQELPSKSLGNGGQGGPDRRAGDAGRAGPSSVKVRLLTLLQVAHLHDVASPVRTTCSVPPSR